MSGDPLEELDFKPQLPCEALNNCNRTAEWKVTLRCCDHVFVLCHACFLMVKTMTELMPDEIMRCRYCHDKLPYGTVMKELERIDVAP